MIKYLKPVPTSKYGCIVSRTRTSNENTVSLFTCLSHISKLYENYNIMGVK